MRIFVSSSYTDLREHRAAAIRVLRQLGHEVLAMEDMAAGASAPLVKVREMVDRAEAYVGIFAWRYGYVPPSPLPVEVAGAVPGETSITHLEYLRARERDIPVLAFLLDENEPWSPKLVDGFDQGARQDPDPTDSTRIRALRHELAQEKVISWFTTPADLGTQVGTAVTMVGLTSQTPTDVQPAVSVASGGGSGAVGDSGGNSIAIAVGEAAADAERRVFRIDLAEPWWSTRLYLLAALAERLTQVRRILIVHGQPSNTSPGLAAFVGQVGTSTVLAALRPRHVQLERFEKLMQARPVVADEPEAAAMECMNRAWAPAFGGPRATIPGAQSAEEKAKVDLTPDRLRRWFGDAMLQQPLEIADLKRVSVLDLLRLVDYPSPFVPVLSGRAPGGAETVGQVDVLDKTALNARLAHSYLTELKERARIV